MRRNAARLRPTVYGESWLSLPPSNRRGDSETTAPGCDARARSVARPWVSLAAEERTIPVALVIADVHAPARDIDITHLQSQSFAQAQGQAIEREEEHPLTQNAGGGEYPLGLLDGDDVPQALSPGRLDQTGGHPRLTQHVCVIKLQPVQAKFDRTPGVRCHPLGEVIRQLLLRQAVNLMIKAIPNSADGAGSKPQSSWAAGL